MGEPISLPLARLQGRDCSGLPLTVVGAGNAGLALAADLALASAEVSLLEHPDCADAVAPFAQDTAIELEFAGGGTAPARLARVGTDARTLLRGAQIVLVAAPAFAHAAMAEFTVDHIEPNAIVVLFTGGLGALEWHTAALHRGGAPAFTLVETSSLPYAARRIGPHRVRLLLRVSEISVAAFPAERKDRALGALAALFPGVSPGRDLLEPMLRNVNGVVHPPVMILNVTSVEDRSNRPWFVWRDGVTPAVAKAIEALDQERVSLATAFGLQIPSAAEEQSRMGYGPRGSLCETLTGSQVLRDIEGPHDMRHRFFTEDIPFFLAPWLDLAHMAELRTPLAEAFVRIAGTLCGADWIAQRRRLDRLAPGVTSTEDLIDFLATGVTTR